MAAQFDFIAGLDPSSLASITQAQLLQMINQIAPLSNVGGVILQAGTSLAATIAQGTGGSPDVTNNPRFARYIWLNSYSAASAAPTPYYYNSSTGNWTASSIAALSIVNADISASANIAVTKLAAGTAYYVVRTNSAGTAIEFVSPANLHDSIKLGISGITPNGSDGFLKTASGVMAWSTNATEYAAFQSAIAALAVSKLAAGSNGDVLYSAAGVPTWAAPATAFPSGSNIPPAAIAQGGAATNNLMVWSGSAWVPITQSLIVGTTSVISTTGVIAALLADASTVSDGELDTASFAIPHGLGAVPKLWKVVVYCKGNDAASGYVIGDEITAESWVASVGGEVSTLMCLYADATYIYGTKRTTVAGETYVQDKGVSNALRGNVTSLANFQYKAYAWK